MVNESMAAGSANGPAYLFKDFHAACCKGTEVEIWPDAQRDAKIFHLESKDEILAFICQKEYGKIDFQNTEQGRLPSLQAFMIDGYTFHFGKFTKGYLAFYFVGKTGKWVIKSLHEASDSSRPFATLLKNFDKKQLGGSNGKGE